VIVKLALGLGEDTYRFHYRASATENFPCGETVNDPPPAVKNERDSRQMRHRRELQNSALRYTFAPPAPLYC